MVIFKNLTAQDMTEDLLLGFHHHQKITNKWIRNQERWEIIKFDDLRTWNTEKRIWISGYLCQQVRQGGAAVAAIDGEKLVGFCCIDGGLKGKTANYANLTMLFVDDNWKRKGIGRELFRLICRCAQARKAYKLFISAIPSVETIAFYFSLGCVDAREMIPDYIDTEQDRCLEFALAEIDHE